MNFWEKLLNDPERGPRINSPLARAAMGLGLLFFCLHSLITGAMKVSKAGDGMYIHFSDHPKLFVMTCVGTAIVGIWMLVDAHRRYRRHEP